ncbi:LCP family protein [Candidatus Saccharibacteria bacterium]|nr:LCP family protein [Candidatus Saccharibacteria bacterium]
MTKNKSIDGLSTRAEKISASKVATKKPTKAKKPITPKLSEDFINAPTDNMWDSIKLESNFSDNTDDLNTIDTSDFKEKPVAKKPKTIDFKPKKSNEDTSFLKPIQAFDFNEEDGLTESEDTVEDIKNLHQDPDKKSDEDTEEEPAEMSKKELKKEKKEQKKLAKSLKKGQKKPSKKRKVISIVALIIVLILIGGVIWMVLWGNDIIAKITGGRGNLFDLFSLNSETYEPLKTDSNGRTNILAIGTSGYNMDGDEGNGVHDGAQLTDSIMVISFDQKTGDVAMISLPRDLKGPSTCTSTGKINEVYWCNGGSGDASIEQEEKAVTAVMDAVGDVLGIDFQYYAHLNWGSLASIVDILGGITVTLDEDILDYYYTEAVYYKDTPYTINGAEAVGLARARHGTTGGDFSRGASQQKILIGIKDRILEKGLTISDMLGLASTLGDNLRTNFSISEIKTLAHDLGILDFDVMRQISLYPDYMTTGMLNGISYVLPKAGAGNYTAIQRYVAKQLSSDPRDYEEPTIAIYNASDTAGLAASEKSKLEQKGYTIKLVDNAPEGEYPAGTTIYATTTEKPGTFSLLETDYNFTPLSKDALPATIAPDYDFIIILND